MTDATDKQKELMKKLGIDFADAISKGSASDLIEDKLGESKKTDKPEFKPKFDTSSYYVAYAKDLCVAMLTAQAEALSTGALEAKDLVEVPALMGIAIQCIEFARNKFK